MNDDVRPIRRGMTNHSELQLGREIALEVPAMVREMQCKPCGIGVAIARVEKRNGISPVFDWAGMAARKAGHKCQLTTWDKAPVVQDSRLPPERDDDDVKFDRVPGEEG
jgi:hypothetical protein